MGLAGAILGAGILGLFSEGRGLFCHDGAADATFVHDVVVCAEVIIEVTAGHAGLSNQSLVSSAAIRATVFIFLLFCDEVEGVFHLLFEHFLLVYTFQGIECLG